VAVTPEPAAPQPADGASSAGGLRTVLEAAAAVVGLAVYVYVIGWVVSWVRFTAARLPADVSTSDLAHGQLFGTGLRSTALMAVAFAIACAVAYLSSHRRWAVHGPDWHHIVREHGVGNARSSPAIRVSRAVREARAAQESSRARAARSDRIARATDRIGLKRASGRWDHRRERAEQLAGLPNPAGTVRARRWRRAATAAGRLRLGRVETWAAGNAEVHEALANVREDPIGPVTAPLGEWAVRLVAGFNIGVLSVLIAVGFARFVEQLFPSAWWVILLAGVIAFFCVRAVLTQWSPLTWGPRVHGAIWVVVAVGALFASAPIGVLVLTAVAIATAGRALARLRQPRTPSEVIRSPLPWILLSILMLVGLAYWATPPVSFPRVVVTTDSGQLVGGYLNRSATGVSMVTCVPLADATSTDEHVRFVAQSTIKGVALGGTSASFDSGERPSLAALAFGALGVNGRPPTWFNADLRARRGTCAGATPTRLTVGYEDPALGYGVIAGPAPPGGQAHAGEQPIEVTSSAIAQLARMYQPTLLVTVADRNWPVSVGAVMDDRGYNGETTCLIQTRSPQRLCAPQLSPSSLAGAGSTSRDYLQYPVRLKRTPSADPLRLQVDPSPTGQFEPFERGQYVLGPGERVTTSVLRRWLADPGQLDPWYTAQVYFYYAGAIASSRWPVVDKNATGTLYGLEYWFYYPFNYYAAVAGTELMNDAPIAGDHLDIDLHQGDWEHVTVLLDSKFQPAWLYMARHSQEGQFVPWSSPALSFDHGHPVVQAAYGGHPTYLAGCGPRPRPITDKVSSDWLVCGSGRFAFRAATTPLVDIAKTPWACWPGHFGEAVPGIELASSEQENVIDQARHVVYVDGPQAPLTQGENKRVACTGNPPTPTPVPLPAGLTPGTSNGKARR
jgi:hypothetical protein